MIDDIALYLKAGRNRFGLASGPMADAITHSLSHLADADIRAMAVYLKSLPAAGDTAPQALSGEEPKMQQGAAIYDNPRNGSCKPINCITG